MVLSCTGGYNGASLSAGGQYFSPVRSSVTNLVVRISCYLFENKKMRKSQNIRTYAFLLHDLPMKFSPILPFLTRFRKKSAWLFLQLDLRRNATRCMFIIADSDGDFKYFLNGFRLARSYFGQSPCCRIT